MSATYTQHRDHTENTQLARMERISAALHDPRIAWTLYHALGRIVGTAQVEDVRAIACEALMSVEFYAHSKPELKREFIDEMTNSEAEAFVAQAIYQPN